MDRYKKLAKEFEMDELEERIEFLNWDVQGLIDSIKKIFKKPSC